MGKFQNFIKVGPFNKAVGSGKNSKSINVGHTFIPESKKVILRQKMIRLGGLHKMVSIAKRLTHSNIC